MKNTKLFHHTTPVLTALTLAIVGFNPALTEANIFDVDLGVSQKTQVSNQISNTKLNANANINAEANTRIGSNFQNESRNDDRDDKDDKEYKNNKDDKKNKNNREDKVIPPGIAKKFDGDEKDQRKFFNWFFRFFGGGNGTNNASSTVNLTMPVIFNAEVRASTTTAQISWKTNELTSGEVRYGTSTSVGASSSVAVDSSVSMNHLITLVGLTADTKYYFTITAKDVDGNVKTTAVVKFNTKKVSVVGAIDTVAPQILFHTTLDTKANSTRVLWFTNEKSNSKVWVSTSTPVNVSTANVVRVDGRVNIHDVQIKGLTASTLYYYAITSADASGNVTATTTGSFSTLAS